MSFVTRSGSEFRLDGKKFRFVGFNYYPAVIDGKTQEQMRALFQSAKRRGVRVFRFWCFDKGHLPTNSTGNFRYLSNGQLVWREATFQQLDMVMDEARRADIKVILVLADNPTYNTKSTYIRWSDAIYGTDYYTPVAKSVVSAVLAGNVITVTTSAAHGFHVGQIVTTSGANEADFNNTTAFISSVPSATTFTYAKTAANATATGTMSVIRHSSYKTQNFYRDANCKQMYKDFFLQLANRVNTYNGRTYKNDDTIFSWEMGNELRYDQDNDPGINGSDSHNVSVVSGLVDGTAEQSWEYATSWAKEMADYFKSVDANHLVCFGSMAHGYQWVSGDTVWNGSYYGVDYGLLSAIDNIDYLDFHIYPTQGGTALKKYGQKFGAPDAVNRNGLIRQLHDYIKVGHANNKPVMCGEIGFDRDVNAATEHYPLHPRHNAFKYIFRDFFDAGGDGMLIWSATQLGGGSYSVGLDASGGEAIDDNTDDTKLMSLVQQRNSSFNKGRILVDSVQGISI